jgi:DNA-binding MarR family transcriptional regulator
LTPSSIDTPIACPKARPSRSRSQRGWLERRKDPDDRRRNVVVLIEAGTAKLGEGRAAAYARAQELTAPLTAKERRALRDLLAKIA